MTRVWTRKTLAADATADQWQNPDQMVAFIIAKVQKTLSGEPEHDIDPATIEMTREPLINNPTPISVVDARRATGVLLPRGVLDRWRLTATTRPVIDGVTYDIAPDARDLRIPTYHTGGWQEEMEE